MKKLFQLFTLFLSISLLANPMHDNKRIVVIDPGHGGVDSGVKNDEILEKEIVLEIAQLIKARNPYQDIEFVIIRTGDEQISNENRTKIINSYQPDLVLSLHIHSNVKSTVKGLEAHISPMNRCHEDSEMYAQRINQKLMELGFENLGIKENNTKILRDPQSPTVMLHIGHLSNDEDKEYLSNSENYIKIADKILEGLE
ncbi:N-acetylmuramoyl-L-alanine amidase [Faecalibacter sp. LW9]|uniref:N-acetylmuramoyl-L-alanine amidase family protein n=1 Tax=Faecalibacter sp. LW9 TaxID=3103144 RepID=UPI002AFF09CB|nr:N-acetylmuramoyl-L-alanine amidase [Faecalibacter sp. LW9]